MRPDDAPRQPVLLGGDNPIRLNFKRIKSNIPDILAKL